MSSEYHWSGSDMCQWLRNMIRTIELYKIRYAMYRSLKFSKNYFIQRRRRNVYIYCIVLNEAFNSKYNKNVSSYFFQSSKYINFSSWSILGPRCISFADYTHKAGRICSTLQRNYLMRTNRTDCINKFPRQTIKSRNDIHGFM